MIAWLRGNGWRFLALALLIPGYFVAQVWDEYPQWVVSRPEVRDVKATETVSDSGITWRLNRVENPRPALDANGKPLPPRKDGIHWAVAYVSFKFDKAEKLGARACVTRLTDQKGRVWEPSGGTATLGLKFDENPPDCVAALDGKAAQPGRWYRVVTTFMLPGDAKDVTAEVALGKKVYAGIRPMWARFVS